MAGTECKERDYTEAWMDEHEAVKNNLWEFEDAIARGLALHKNFTDRFWAWHADVTTRKEKFTIAREDAFRSLFEWWLRPCEALFKELGSLESQYGSVAGGKEFRVAFQKTATLMENWQSPKPQEVAAAHTEVSTTVEQMARGLDRVSRDVSDQHVRLQSEPDTSNPF